ncbi:hypothetical protein J6590_049808 [Homalodisca vitripennis]|nr:hypothetical protein J6590_049808 [Homalodisca vitripennis]
MGEVIMKGNKAPTPLSLFHLPLTCGRDGWRKLGGGGLNRMQNRALADLVSRLDQDPKPSSGANEDSRTRRRRLYRMASEQRPAFPFQHRNFYSHVMENKEVVKTLSLLSSCTQEIKPVSTLL